MLLTEYLLMFYWCTNTSNMEAKERGIKFLKLIFAFAEAAKIMG
jgi:hypothetical protein